MPSPYTGRVEQQQPQKPPTAPPRDMTQHVTILGAFHIVLGGLGLVIAFVIIVVFGRVAGAISLGAADEPDAWIAIPAVGIVGSVLLVIALTLSLPGIVAGLGLIKHKAWARVLAIVLSVLHLINFPFGTLLSIYGLWVLLSRDTERLFET